MSVNIVLLFIYNYTRYTYCAIHVKIITVEKHCILLVVTAPKHSVWYNDKQYGHRWFL